MLSGLSLAAGARQVIGIPVLKHEQIGNEVAALARHNDITLLHQFHQGGYAKQTPDLLSFMNRFYEATAIPTDFVYTGKLKYAIAQLIHDQYFPPGSRILAIHSGGLQGNKSLKKGVLAF
jgi:1-aminocyclopropane-1-carboxylate deaminase